MYDVNLPMWLTYVFSMNPGYLVVTDTIPDGERLNPIRDKLQVLTVAKLLGEAVHRIHHDMSISALFRRAGETKR